MKDMGVGIVVGVFIMFILLKIFPHTKHYYQGIEDTHKEAFEHGLMVKEIDKDDKVIYRWKELHSIGYEENN